MAKNVVPLYRYYNAGVHDHLYTTDPTENGTAAPGEVGNNGFLCEGIECLVYNEEVIETVPLHRYWNEAVEDHLYTTNADEIETTTCGDVGKNGYRYEGIVGYCFIAQCKRPDYTIVPLYRYWNPARQDHFYTIHQEEANEQEEIIREGVACYVLISKEDHDSYSE